MNICIAGKNSIAINTTKYLLKNHSDISLFGLTNQTDNGINSFEPSYKSFLEINSIPQITLEQAQNMEDLLFISLEYDRIIRVDRFKSNKLFNIHFSLLPAYKGMYTSALPILNGEKYTGVTLHKIDKGIDTGDIIDQIKINLFQNDTAKKLYSRYITEGTHLIIKNIDALMNNEFKSVPQKCEGASYYSKKSINYKELEIDYNKTAFEIVNQIRAFSFRDFQMPKYLDFQISHAEITKEKSVLSPGKIVFENEFQITISSIDYNVNLFKDKLDDFLDACSSGNTDRFLKLLPFIPDIDEKNKNGWNAIIVAVYNNNIEIVDMLINLGSDLNCVNKNGTTLLMYAKDAALNSGSYTMIDCMIENGLKNDKKDFFGKTVLDYVYNQSIDVYNYLNSKND
jgi:methionyl-tRNA formyltransferase